MPTPYAIQAILHHDSGLPADYSVNTWSVQANDASFVDDAVNEIHQLYVAMGTRLSQVLTGAMTYKVYDRTDLPPRVPIYVDTSKTFGTAGDAGPAQVALCLSFQGVRLSGAPQSRRRGRIFLGPLAKGAIDSGTGRPISTAISALVTAADTLLASSIAATGWDWAVWSEKNNDSVLVNNGWVDDRFDTQRSRLPKATTRSTFS